jgi:hypothetical protein
MIDATIIPEPVDSIFRVFWIGNDGNDNAWLGELKGDISQRRCEVVRRGYAFTLDPSVGPIDSFRSAFIEAGTSRPR